MKIYVINLDRSKDRLDHITKIFAEQHLEFNRVPGIDGRKLNDELLSSYASKLLPLRHPSPAEIGCFLSHRECLRLVAEGEDDFAAIFEDDIQLSPNAHLFLRGNTWIDPAIDIVKLDMMNMKCLTGAPSYNLMNGYRLAPLLSKHYGAAGYVVSRTCAAHLYMTLTKVSAAIDELFFDPSYGLAAGRYNIQQLMPAIAKQVGFPSNIQPPSHDKRERIPSKLPITKKIIRECKRTKERKLRPFMMTIFKGCRWGKIPFE